MKTSSPTRNYYVITLIARFVAFGITIIYALSRSGSFLADLEAGLSRFSVLTVLWAALMISMILRLFPSRSESLGCQKEFAGRFRSTGKDPSGQEIRSADRGALLVLLSWLALNGVFYFIYAKGIVNAQFMVCLAAFYGVCDVICILFFCPFQAWMMKNRCCTTCRIYNWDYMMICTPLIPLGGILAISACLLAAVLLVRWELTYRYRAQRFFESSNAALRCGECTEQLCKYKRVMAGKPVPAPRRSSDRAAE